MKGHITQPSPGSWSLVIDLGRDENGKRKQKWITFRGGKREAQRELNRILHEMDTGAFVEPSKLTVSQYLERWLADYAKSNVSAKTYEGYSDFIRLHLTPALGQVLLSKLSPLHIQSYYTRALEGGRRDGKGGLSARTVLHHHRVLHEALEQAVKWEILARNPADAVEPPRPEHHEMQVMDEEETVRLLDAAKGTRLHVPILLAAMTGMRRGEVLGLRWQDVDLKVGRATVNQTLQRTKAGMLFKEPKTQKSRRGVALPALVVDALVHHKGKQAEQKLLLGPTYQDHGLVVTQDDGQPMSPHALSMAFLGLLRRAGLRQVRFHDLRHTHATHLGKMGVPAKVVSERLGHSTVSITLDLYSHVLPGMQEDAAQRVDAAFRAALAD